MKIPSMKNGRIETLAIDSTCSHKTGQYGEEKEGEREGEETKGKQRQTGKNSNKFMRYNT